MEKNFFIQQKSSGRELEGFCKFIGVDGGGEEENNEFPYFSSFSSFLYI